MATTRRYPLLVAGALAAIVAGPVGSWFVGTTLAPDLAGAFADRFFATSLLTSVAFSCVTSGVFVGAVSPRLDSLDEQLRTAPVGHGRLFVSVTLVPLLPLLGWSFLVAAGVLVPLGAATPGGPVAGLALLSCTALCVGLGAALPALLSALARRRPEGGLLVPVAATWVACAWPADTLPEVSLGPVRLAVAALEGDARAATLLVLVGPLVIAAAGGSWLLASIRSGTPSRVHAARVTFAGRADRPARAVLLLVAGAAMLSRRTELRRNALASLIATPVVAAALRYYSPLPDLSLLFAGMLAVLGTVVFPLSAAAFGVDGRWVHAVGPGFRIVRIAATLAAGVLVQFTVVAVSVGVLAVLLGLGSNSAGTLFVATALACSAALLAGYLVPWRGDSIASQAGSFLVLASIGLAVYLLSVRLVDGAVTVGVPLPLLAAAVPSAVLTACIALAATLIVRRDLAWH